MYQVFELQKAAFDASVSKMVDEYEQKFVPQVEAVTSYDIEIDNYSEVLEASIELLRGLINEEIRNCDKLDEVYNYLKIYDHSTINDIRKVLNGSNIIIDMVKSDLNIIRNTDDESKDKDKDNDKEPNFIDRERMSDEEADTRNEMIHDIVDPVAGEDEALGGKGTVDTSSVTEAIKEKNKEEAEAKQKAADEAKTEAEQARQRAEAAKQAEERAIAEVEKAKAELDNLTKEAASAAEKGNNITVLTENIKPGGINSIIERAVNKLTEPKTTFEDLSKPMNTTSFNLSEIDGVITDKTRNEQIKAGIEAAKEALANGATTREAEQAAKEAIQSIKDTSVSGWLREHITPRNEEAIADNLSFVSVRNAENQIAAQEAAANVAGAQAKYEEALEQAKQAGQNAAELESQYEQAKQEADIREAEAKEAADAGSDESGHDPGSDASCDCDTSGQCDTGGGGCRTDAGGCGNDCDCDNAGCDCDSDPACGKDGYCGSDSCKRETDD